MNLPIIIGSYMLWHYTEALNDIFRIVGNYIWFFNNMFSIPLFLRTLFSPFKRLEVEKNKSWAFEDWGGRLIVNGMMRLVGLVMRLTMIGIGLVFILLTIVMGAVIFIIWLVLPVAVIAMFFIGVLQFLRIF